MLPLVIFYAALIIVAAILSLALVFLPTIVAIIRKHRQLVPILILNIFLWWTFIAWAVALAWAFVKESDDKEPSSPA